MTLKTLLIFLFSFGHFAEAVDLDFDLEGAVYVVDRESNMLVKYSPRGDSLRSVTGYGEGTLQFDEPVAVYARRGTDVFVADYNNHRIQRFDRQLDYITTMYTRDDPDERKRFGYPRDVAVSRQGDVLIVDGENRRILKIDPFGKVERAFGDMNAGAGRLIDPSGIEVDNEDNIYVLDEGGVKVYDTFGSYLRTIPGVEGRAFDSFSIRNDTAVFTLGRMVRLYDVKRRGLLQQSYTLEDIPVGVHRRANRLYVVGRDRVDVYERDE